MSYRLDPNTGRLVLNEGGFSRPSRIEETYTQQRNFTGGLTPDLIRTNSESKYTRDSNQAVPDQNRFYVSSKPIEPQTYAQPVRQNLITNLKNELSNIKTEASRLVTREENGTRRIILMNNGRRVFDPDSADRISVSSDIPVKQAPRIREPMSNQYEAREYFREAAMTPKPTSAVYDRGSPVVRDFTMAATQNYFQAPPQPIVQQPLASQSGYVLELERKNKELEAQTRVLQDQINVITNDGEAMVGDLNLLRNENSQLKMQLGAMKEFEGRLSHLRQEADGLFEENNRLRNEISLLKGELQHSTLSRSESNVVLEMQEEIGNLKSELAGLANIRFENEAMMKELAGFHELQKDYSQLRGELFQLHTLQSENSALKSELSQANTQLSLMKNEVAMYKAKSGSVESESRTYLESLNSQLQKLQSDISGFEAMKRNLEAKFGYPSLPVDDFVEKIFMMLNDNIGMMDALTLKDEQLQEFRTRMEQNQQAIEQLTSIRRSYEDNLKSINSIHDSDRGRLLELTRLYEQAKIQLKQQGEELSKAEQRERQRGNIAEDETVVRLLKNKDVEITKLQVQLKNATVRMERAEKDLQQERQQIKERLTADKNEMMQSSGAEIGGLRMELQASAERAAMMEEELNRRQQLIDDLTANINNYEEKLNSTLQELEGVRGDLKELTELYNTKEREGLEIMSRAERTEAECNQKIDKYDNDMEMLRMKQENLYHEFREQEQQLRRELDEVRSNWHTRLMHEIKTFDEALREQIEELNVLKTKVTEKDDQIFQLKDTLFTNQSANTALRAQVEIEKLKSITERKTQHVAYEVELQNARNDLNNIQKAMDSLGQKLKQAVQDNRKKDEFIHKYVMGKKPDEKFNIQLFFRQYEILVPSEGLKNRLVEEQKQIQQLQQLNRVLARELLAARK